MINKEVAKLTATMQFALDKKSKSEINKFIDTINKYEAVSKKANNSAKKDWNEQLYLVSKYDKKLQYVAKHDKVRASILEGQFKRIAKVTQSTKDWKRATLNLRDAYDEVKKKVDAANKSANASAQISRQRVKATTKKHLAGRLDWMFPTGKPSETSKMYAAEEKAGQKVAGERLKQTEQYFKANTAALSKLNEERKKSFDRINKQVFETKRIIKSQKLSKEQTNSLYKEIARLSRQFAKTGDLVQYKIALRKIGDQARSTERPINKLRSTISRMLSAAAGAGIGAQFGGPAGAALGAVAGRLGGPTAAGIAGVGAFFAGSTKTGMQLEGIENSMRMITDSAAGAREQFSWISDIASRMGTDISTAAEGFTKLAVAAGEKINRQDLQNLFVAFNKYSIAVGQSTFRYEKSLQALTQMLDKGGVYSEELRQQLSENLPGAIQIFADAAGVTTETLFDMMKNRQLKLEDIVSGLTDVMGEAADKNDAFATATQQSSRQLTQLRTNVSILLKTFYDAGLGDFLAQIFRFLRLIIVLIRPLTSLIGSLLAPFAGILNYINYIIERVMEFLDWPVLNKIISKLTRTSADVWMGRSIGTTMATSVASSGQQKATPLEAFVENKLDLSVKLDSEDLKGKVSVIASDIADERIKVATTNPEKRHGGGGRER